MSCLHQLRTIDTVLYFILASITVFGNSIVLLAVWKDPRHQLRTTSAYLIANLAISDLILGVLGETLLGTSYWVHHPPQIIEGACFVFYFTLAASFLTILTLAIERYLVLKYSRRGKKSFIKYHMAFVITGIWILSAVIALPSRLKIITGDKDTHVYRCVFAYLGIFVLVIVLFVYGKLFVMVRRVYRRDLASQVIGEETPLTAQGLIAQRVRRRELHAAWVVFSIVGAYVILSTPAVVAETMMIFRNSRFSEENADYMNLIALLIAAINPGIYAFRTLVFRRAIAATFQCERRKITKSKFPHNAYA